MMGESVVSIEMKIPKGFMSKDNLIATLGPDATYETDVPDNGWLFRAISEISQRDLETLLIEGNGDGRPYSFFGVDSFWFLVIIKKDIFSHLISCSDLLGITDAKVIYTALKTAKAICSLKEKSSVSRDDVNQAVSLVMIQKAKRIPEINDMDEQTQSKQSEEKNEESQKVAQ